MNKYQKLFREVQQEKGLYQNVNDHVLIIDGLNTFIRSFGANPATNEDGDHIGGISGFLYSVGKVVRDFKPTRCVIVFDGVGGSRRRKKINASYKANRANKTKLRRHDHLDTSIEQEQEEMKQQFSRLISYLDCLPVTFLAIDGIEADDTIAAIIDQYYSTSQKMTIVSTDRDFYQLIDDHIQVWSPIKKKMYDAEMLKEEFGVTPTNYVMYRSFTGDTSDNVSGVPGIGPKTLLKHVPELTLNEQFTIDQLIEKSQENESKAKAFKTIIEHEHIIRENHELMDIKLLNFSASHLSKIRSIIDGPIPQLDKQTFQSMFLQDKMWTAMKNAPDWLNKTWLSLSSFAQQTQK